MNDESSPNHKQTVTAEILEDNHRWLRLMNTQSEIHREELNPRLYRNKAKQKLITPKLPIKKPKLSTKK